MVAPKNGASILKCRYAGRDILQPAAENWLEKPEPFASSCFPLVPFSNRIENGQFGFQGRHVNLPPNHSQQTHAIHGIGWTSPWIIKTHEAGLCELELKHTGGDWPWPFRVSYRIKVTGSVLLQSLSMTNTGSAAMPAGLGFHPYFPGRMNARIQFNATGLWETDVNNLPTRWRARQGVFDFSEPKYIQEKAYDHCFTEWDGTAIIDWNDRPDKLVITGAPNLIHAVFYTPQDQPYFCFEPVSHGNNALANTDVMLRGGNMTLNAGSTMRAEMRITVETTQV